METPKRIQLSRAKGWRLPAGAVKVDRTTRWGNPFRVGETAVHPVTGREVVVESAAVAVALCDLYLRSPTGVGVAEAARTELKGKDLACWCRVGTPCHGDILLQIANGGSAQP